MENIQKIQKRPVNGDAARAIPIRDGKFALYSSLAQEQAALAAEIQDLLPPNIVWNQPWDSLMVLLAGVSGGLCDVLIGKTQALNPNAEPGTILGAPAEPVINNDSYWGMGSKLKDFDITNNPIDKHIPGAPLGDHRLYSYGHDLLRFFNGVSLLMTGKGAVGLDANGHGVLEAVSLNCETVDDLWKAILIQALHLYKDFWSQRSLPIPGSTIIGDLNDHKIPDFLHELTNNKDFNLRVLSGQLLSVAACEVIIRIYVALTKGTAPAESIARKKDIMLLGAHSVAMLFNAGKIYATGNPFLLNVPQLLMIMRYAFKVVKANTDDKRQYLLINHKFNQIMLLESMKTIVLMEHGYSYCISVREAINDMDRLKREQWICLDRDVSIDLNAMKQAVDSSSPQANDH